MFDIITIITLAGLLCIILPLLSAALGRGQR